METSDSIIEGGKDKLVEGIAELIPLILRPYRSFLLYQTYGINRETYDNIDDDE